MLRWFYILYLKYPGQSITIKIRWKTSSKTNNDNVSYKKFRQLKNVIDTPISVFQSEDVDKTAGETT